MPRILKATQAVTEGEMPIKDLDASELMSYRIPSMPRTSGEHRLGHDASVHICKDMMGEGKRRGKGSG